MLFSRLCPGCGRAGPALCAPCRASLRRAPALAPPPGVDRCRALLSYEGTARRVVTALKYRNHRSAIGVLARSMAALVDPADVDLVTWVPTSPGRRRARGYDQAELLARRVARQLGRPCRSAARRGPGPAQTGRGRRDRQRGPELEVVGAVLPPRILLVDDVVTTGASVRAMATALRAAGVDRVEVLALARTPDRRVPTHHGE